MIVVDTSGVFAALDRSQSDHEACGAVLEGDEPLVLSPFVLAELDYLLATRVSAVASVELLRDVEAGAFELASFGADDVATAATIVDRFVDLGIGLADASILVLTERYKTDRVLTLDQRHFRALRTASGEGLTLLPADS